MCWRRCVPVIRESTARLSGARGIRGADFFISAIGPALSVFGRHSSRAPSRRYVRSTVRDFLDIVRRESTTVALEQVLHGADLGRGRPNHAPVRDVGVELLARLARLGRGDRALPRHGGSVRGP